MTDHPRKGPRGPMVIPFPKPGAVYTAPIVPPPSEHWMPSEYVTHESPSPVTRSVRAWSATWQAALAVAWRTLCWLVVFVAVALVCGYGMR